MLTPGSLGLPLLVLEALAPGLERLLVDVRCSFATAEGEMALFTSASASAPPLHADSADAEAIAAATRAVLFGGAGRALVRHAVLDLSPGAAAPAGERPEASPPRLADGIALLCWICEEPVAAALHRGVQTYLHALDPDLLLSRPVASPLVRHAGPQAVALTTFELGQDGDDGLTVRVGGEQLVLARPPWR